ncbi:cell cycle checkpoint protein RAD17 isoform X1 [Polyodon spathula]|uniref:cell cycle checkpoint protein RAD17 isoform X1 n=1 Tax=Polyodon spathula TaxID=7913 RepID=UPI001B7E42A2|nr:cell cycle checkpoint protein RAD17 isoform X1 [Polyodon spathula]
MSKSSLSRKVASGKLTNWVQPSFDDLFGGASLKSLTSKKRTNSREPKGNDWSSALDASSKLQAKKRTKAPFCEQPGHFTKEYLDLDQDVPWVDKYKPESQAELAVHKKKIEEVENWLSTEVQQRQPKKGGSILLMTGPSGCGKTATVQVLTKELGVQIQEWSNPTSLSEFNKDDYKNVFDPESRFRGFTSESQSAVFQEFLLRANKYNKLQMFGEAKDTNKKVILIEEVPNQFYRQPASLHDILRRFIRTGRCPLIFIISDSLSGDSNQWLLFPKDIQEELNISNISFNPVAPTSMMKVLSRIAAQETSRSGGKVSVPDKDSLDQLCSGSSGDIRSAINSLQFSSLKDYAVENSLLSSKKGKASSKASKTSTQGRNKDKSSKTSERQEGLQAIGGKDVSLFLFRALGKILHFKREPRTEPELPHLPDHLSEHERDPLLVDPEMVTEKCHMSGELFNMYLHQNYLEFFSNIEDVVRASEYLSDADFLTAEWSSRSSLREYSASVAARGMIHSNKARAFASSQTGVGFKPLHKPQWLLINRKYQENCLVAKSLFISFCMPPACLQTQLLPYLALLTNPMRNQAQIAFIQDVGRLPLKKYPRRLKLEALTDKDPVVDLDSDEDDPAVSAYAKPKGEQSQAPGPDEDLQSDGGSLPSSQTAGGDLPGSQPQPTAAQAIMKEEEIVIEDYDSD